MWSGSNQTWINFFSKIGQHEHNVGEFSVAGEVWRKQEQMYSEQLQVYK